MVIAQFPLFSLCQNQKGLLSLVGIAAIVYDVITLNLLKPRHCLPVSNISSLICVASYKFCWSADAPKINSPRHPEDYDLHNTISLA